MSGMFSLRNQVFTLWPICVQQIFACGEVLKDLRIQQRRAFPPIKGHTINKSGVVEPSVNKQNYLGMVRFYRPMDRAQPIPT